MQFKQITRGPEDPSSKWDGALLVTVTLQRPTRQRLMVVRSRALPKFFLERINF